MKRLLTLGALLFSFIYLFAQPKMEFKSIERDFGTIKEDAGLATTVFEFKNKGDQPLIINNATATCGCTTPEWTKEPIAPGKSGSIKVSYNPKNRPGQFNKNVNVYSNADPSMAVLTIKGKVEPRQLSIEEQYPREMGGIRWKTNYLTLGTVLNSQEKTDTLAYYNSSSKDVKVGIYRVPAYMTVSFEPEVVPAGKYGKMTVKYDAKRRNAFGNVSDRIYLDIDGQKDNNFSIGVSVTINEDFGSLTEEQKANAPSVVVESNVFDFGNIKEGESPSFLYKLTNTGKSDLIIRSVKASCGCTAVKNESIVKPGATTDVKATFNSKGKRGRQNKTITVITNDPNNSTIQLRVIGNVL
jgi:hypothetical protein